MARILVLDDDEELRDVLCEALQAAQHEPHPVASGPEAIAAATRSRFDLIVSDVQLPGMDGLDCLKALLPVQPTMRRLVITGYADDDLAARALAVQADDYLHKPFQLEEFIQAVNRVVDAHREAGLLASLTAAYRRLLTRDPGPDWAALDARRHLAYQSLFLGIRSGKLCEPEAVRLWDGLEAMEPDRERYRSEGLSREQARALLEGYQYAIDLAAALTRPTPFAPMRRPEGAADFQPFWERIKRGEVSLEQLKLAPFLRSLPESVVASSPQLSQLYEQVWGPADRK